MRGRVVIAVLCALACAGPSSRIKKDQAAFDAYPPEVQERIRAGKVDVGFSEEQVLMALGKPDRKYQRTTGSETVHVWGYGGGGGAGPRVGVGVGVGSYGGRGGVFGSGDVTVGGGGYAREERARVVFKEGRVTAVEGRID